MKQEKILITGGNGQLGKALQQKYPKATATDVDDLDITNQSQLESFDWSGYGVIINAAAYTNVDGAETPEGRELAYKVNAEAVSNLAQIALKHNITLIHISTDYVFDGTKTLHTENETFTPINVYGDSKTKGDKAANQVLAHYILRTSWVIGDGKNFVKTMKNLGEKGVEPTVVNDQIGRPTFTNELVRAIDHLTKNKVPFGTYNVSNSGKSVSWADLTREIFKALGISNKVFNTSTKEYFAGKESIAPRPLNSIFDLSKIQSTGFKSTDWKDDLLKYLKQEKN